MDVRYHQIPKLVCRTFTITESGKKRSKRFCAGAGEDYSGEARFTHEDGPNDRRPYLQVIYVPDEEGMGCLSSLHSK